MADHSSILQKNYDFLLYLIPVLQKFPRNQKFLLADRIQNKTLDNQELLIQAFYSKPDQKVELLKKVNIQLEQLRFLFRLCHDLKYVDTGRYEFISKLVNEVGAMLGSWMKSL